jgi:thiamine-phosphate pyrophosphorylase
MESRLSIAVPPLFLVTDPHAPDARIITVVREAVAGGVTHVVLRRTTATARDVHNLAVILRPLVAKAGAVLVISDRVDVALAMDDVGAHLGRRSLRPATARKITTGRLLGASVSSLGEAFDAAQAGVDYVTFGNVFETKSHPGQPGRGFELLRDVVDAVDVPVIAIGGVTADRVDSLVGSGATGISVIRAIGDASDPRKAAQELRNALDAAHRRKQ